MSFLVYSTFNAKFVSSVAHQEAAFAKSCEDSWLHIWQIAARSINSVANSRTSCYLLAVVLEKGLVKYTDIADLVDALLASVDLNGPAVNTESAVALWSAIITMKGRQKPGLAYDTSERVLRWLFIRWRPCRFDDVFVCF